MAYPALADKRILVVEDEYFIAVEVRQALRGESAIVIGPTGDLAAGLKLVANGGIDAAVIDVNLGDESSYPLADRLLDAGIPFMFLTGYDGWALPEKYRGVRHLGKPFPIAALLGAVEAVLSEPVSA